MKGNFICICGFYFNIEEIQYFYIQQGEKNSILIQIKGQDKIFNFGYLQDYKTKYLLNPEGAFLADVKTLRGLIYG